MNNDDYNKKNKNRKRYAVGSSDADYESKD